MKYKVNEEKCIGCGACASACPEGMRVKEDGKAEVIDSEKVKECGGEKICPIGAIEKIEEKKED